MGWGRIFPELIGVALRVAMGGLIVGGEANACSQKSRWGMRGGQRGRLAASGTRGNGAVIAGAAV